MRKRKSPLNSFLASAKDYFTFTINERKGTLILISSQILLLFVLFFYDFSRPEQVFDALQLENSIAQLNELHKQDSIDRATAVNALKHNTSFIDSAKTITVEGKLFAFNPNNLADSLWMQLGLSENQIRVIKNYETKGGKFFTKEDVQKMYCITPQLYTRLEPYINISETKKIFTKDTANFSTEAKNELIKRVPAVVDLNTATTEQLDSLPAIGTYRAEAILKYRDMLGGYTDIVQLKEVMGMNDSTYDAIKNFVTIRTKNIRKININSIDAMQLKHPYLSVSLAKLILNYRKMHGDYKDVADLKKLKILSDETYIKLFPYLNIH